jgi:hypothetical protein
MPKFRKKPVVIEAMQWSGATGPFAIQKWLNENGKFPWLEAGANGEAMVIPTLEGNMRAELNDWIIRGVKGEFYPCKPDIFEATYERVGYEEIGP